MDWDRLEELQKLIEARRADEALPELSRLAESETDPTNKGVLLDSIAIGLRVLGRFSEARRQVREACAVLGPEHVAYPAAAFHEALLDMDERKWKPALKKLDVLLKKYGPVLHEGVRGGLFEEVQRNRGMALVELRRSREARPLLESVRSIEYEKERTLCYLGLCDFELGDRGAARQEFEELLALPPASTSIFRASAHYYLGVIFVGQRQLARALAEFEKCLACPERGLITAKNLLGWLVNTSKALNLREDATRYSKMLKEVSGGRRGAP